MAAGIEVQVGKIRGPWLNVVIERVRKHYVMGVITAHHVPGFEIPTHTPKPEMLAGVWKLPSYTQESAGGIKLVGIQAELFPEDFKRVDGAVRRWRLKLVINKSGVGFFEVEGIAIVSNGYITGTKELMEFFYEHPVVIEIFFVPSIIREGSHCYFTLPFPAVSEA